LHGKAIALSINGEMRNVAELLHASFSTLIDLNQSSKGASKSKREVNWPICLHDFMIYSSSQLLMAIEIGENQ
jgi:hypothetical protein